MFRFRPDFSRLYASHLLWPVWLTPGWLALWLAVSVPVDGQAPLERATGEQRTDTSWTHQLRGLGVFGQALGIHGQDSLLVAGDLVLDQAEVVGEGVLLLKSPAPQRLIARRSMLVNLAIDNPTRVALHGDLRIKQRLTIKEGTFTTSDGTLRLDAACQTHLLAGGQLKTGLLVRHARPLTGWTFSASTIGLAALAPVLPAPASRAIKRGVYRVQSEPQYTSLAHKKPVPPPEIITL